MKYDPYYQNLLKKVGKGSDVSGLWKNATTNTNTFNSLFKPLIGTEIKEIYKLLGGSIHSADGFYCFYCENKGNRENCDQCDEGANSCDEGCEEGYWTCDVCDGNPEIICGVCEGGNSVDCPECEEGYNNCENCGGEGNIACEQEGCEEGKINCEKCKGIGDCEEEGCEGGIIPCDCDDFDTPDGTVPCDDCEGDGLQRCDDCLAAGVIECGECEHEGYDDCDNWDCNEGYVSCEYCEDGVIECGNCEGDWEGGICDICEERTNIDGMVYMRDWNAITPSVASFSKIMNNNDFPDLKWVVKEVLKEEVRPPSITSDTIFMFHEPTWVRHNPQNPPQLHIPICVFNLTSPPPTWDGKVEGGKAVYTEDSDSELGANYKQLILTLSHGLDDINKIGHISSIQMAKMDADTHNWMWANQNAKALSLKSNIYFAQKGLMNWNTPTPWL